MVKGDWLILYPDHRLKGAEQRKIYGAAQDSIVGLLGLKTISFLDKNMFYQTDSLFRSAGAWSYKKEDNSFVISNGGSGLDPLKGTFVDIVNDTMRITQEVLLSGQKIQLVWHFKKIREDKFISLFKPEKNGWRKKARRLSEKELKEKLKQMLEYYAIYYQMVGPAQYGFDAF
jgi:hypothetical protein